MSDDIKVSVFCLTYNHEPYLRKCLDGFVMQKTNFQFEVLIHDDASTDKSADIIREYEAKYPQLIKPIYQTENQYSKRVKITKTFLASRAKGKYFAWCEGDDYWTDEKKLQKQVDFLESNPEYSCCYHRVLCKNLREGTTRFIPEITTSRDFEPNEIICGGAIFHINSLVIRHDVYHSKPDTFTANGFGDVPLFLYAMLCGKSFVFSDVMSVYNHGTIGSYTLRMEQSAKQKKIEHSMDYIALLERINAFSKHKYNESFTYAINRLQFNIYILNNQKREARAKQYKEFYKQHKRSLYRRFIQTHFPFVIDVLKKFKQRRPSP